MKAPTELWTLVKVMILLDFPNDVLLLPPPLRVSVKSVNMRHTLTWRPLQAACNTTVLYSVQYQGEFELRILNGRWVDAPECRRIPDSHCDLTSDLGSDSDYNLRVRAQCGRELSSWTGLSHTFNRRQTVLTVPDMKVTLMADALQVSFHELPIIASIRVMVWKKDHEQQADVYMIPADQTVLTVDALQEGAVYCVRAQTVLDSELHSSSTDTHCEAITGPEAAWKKPTTITFTVIIVAGFLFAVFWSVIHCHPETCHKYFHKEPLPHSLKPDWDVRTPMNHQEEELCDQIHVVPIVDPRPDTKTTKY